MLSAARLLGGAASRAMVVGSLVLAACSAEASGPASLDEALVALEEQGFTVEELPSAEHRATCVSKDGVFNRLILEEIEESERGSITSSDLGAEDVAGWGWTVLWESDDVRAKHFAPRLFEDELSLALTEIFGEQVAQGGYPVDNITEVPPPATACYTNG